MEGREKEKMVGGIKEREGSPAGTGHCRPGVELEEKKRRGVRWSQAVKNSVFCSFQGKNCLCCYPSHSEAKAIDGDAELTYCTKIRLED